MTSFIANYFKLNNITSEFENKGLYTIKLNEELYQPCLLFLKNENNFDFRLPINKSINYDFTKEKEYDLLINQNIGLRFDKNSSVSFDIFKEKLDKIIKNEQVITYYEKTNKILFFGNQNEDKQWDGKVTEYFNNRKNSIKFQGEMEDGEYVSGIFNNKEETISIQINNIVNNIPNGYIQINVGDDNYNIIYNDDEDINIADKEFVNNFSSKHFGIEFMNKLNFINTVSSNRDHIVYMEIKKLQDQIEKLNDTINNKYVGIFGLIKWIIGI